MPAEFAECVFPFQMAEAFAALDQDLTRQKLQAQIWVNPLGYAFYTQGSETIQENRRITEAIEAVAKQRHLPHNWPSQLSLLFPPHLDSSWQTDDDDLRALDFSVSGSALEVRPVRPDFLLQLQIFYANGESEIPESVRKIARTMRCRTVDEVVAIYMEAFADYPLSHQSLERLEDLMA